MSTVNISKTAIQDFTIRRGDTFYFAFQVRGCDNSGIDLSEFTTARMQFKEHEYATSVLTLTSTGGTGSTNTIDLSQIALGKIVLQAPTENLEAETYYYDLELSNANNFTRTIMSGKMILENDYSK